MNDPSTYERYEFCVYKDEELAHRLSKEQTLPYLIKSLLCEHYGIDMDQKHEE